MVSKIGVGAYDVRELQFAADEAGAILNAAMAFAADRAILNGHTQNNSYAADRDMLVVQHVKIQLASLANQHHERRRLVQCAEDAATALETLAKAHAEDGVRVKTTQPWHHRDD
tara:strand:+ start:276 stop:617 length:342 start_codon:yes stop_codon:yes gene_type:complete